MDLDGIFDKRPSQRDSSKSLEDPWRDPRFAALRQENRPPKAEGLAIQNPLAQAIGGVDDRLQLSRKAPSNPLGSLIRFRRKRPGRDPDADPGNI